MDYRSLKSSNEPMGVLAHPHSTLEVILMLSDPARNSTNEFTVTSPNNIFLLDGNPFPKDDFQSVENLLQENESTEYYTSPKEDYSSFKAMELRRKFPQTANSHRNMRSREKEGYIIHKDFVKFRDFLNNMGPCEIPGYTLDRIITADPEYAPGKVRWASKRTQNNNKGNNVFLTDDKGNTKTISQWAATEKLTANTLYHRKAAGWSDMEVIYGRKTNPNISSTDNPWPYDKQKEWESLYRKEILHKGCGKSKLEFLRDNARNSFYKHERRLRQLIEAIKAKIGYENYDDEYNAKCRIGTYRLCLDEFKDMQLAKIKKMAVETRAKKNYANDIVKQVNRQFAYEKNKIKILLNRNANIKEAEFNKYYDEEYPRPEYTINRPPPNPSTLLHSEPSKPKPRQKIKN